MAIPAYPKILTKTDWDKKKGLIATLTTETGIGALMGQTEALYRKVKWDKFDVRKVLAGGATGTQAQNGYMIAYNEFTKKVTPLADKVDELTRLATTTETTWRNSRKIPRSSTAHLTKVKEAAKLFAAQVKTVRGELDAFNKAGALPTIEDTIGAGWFLKLNQIKIHENPSLVAWTTDDELPISAGDGQRNAQLAQLQADTKVQMAKMKATLVKLKALKAKRLSKKAAIRATVDLWHELGDAYYVMTPGITGLVREWAVVQNNLAKTKEKMAQWEQEHREAMALHKRVERLLFESEVVIQNQEEHVEQMDR